MDANRLSLIRFVTTRYRALQGFRTVADGIFLLADAPGLHLGRARRAQARRRRSAARSCSWLPRRWSRTWSRLATIGGSAGPGERATGDRTVVFAFFVAYAVGVITAQLTDAPWLRAAIATVALGAGPLWVVCRDWPHRAHWLLPLAAAIAGGVMFAGVEGLPAIAELECLCLARRRPRADCRRAPRPRAPGQVHDAGRPRERRSRCSHDDPVRTSLVGEPPGPRARAGWRSSSRCPHATRRTSCSS